MHLFHHRLRRPRRIRHELLQILPVFVRPDGTYGDGTQRNINDLSNNMGGFDTLTPEEMAAVVIYTREELNDGTPADDPNFNSELFAADPAALAAMVEEVAALDPNDPDAVATLDGAETN